MSGMTLSCFWSADRVELKHLNMAVVDLDEVKQVNIDCGVQAHEGVDWEVIQRFGQQGL